MKALQKGRRTKRAVLVALAVLATLTAALFLVACQGSTTTENSATSDQGSSSSTASTGSTSDSTTTTPIVLKVGASVTPHADILRNIQGDLAAQGIDLQIVEYTDYIKPDLDTADGDTDANYFQHQPYLDEFNAENGTDLVSVAAIHFEPLGIYPGQTKSLDALPDGATIAVPNDTTNEARALQLLAAQGLITLPADADLTITPKDIVDNPKNIKFLELDAAAVPRSLDEVDLGVVNGNNALAAGLDTSTVLAAEDPNSQAAKTYANVVVVKAGHENDPAIQALVKALTSDKTRQFINENYAGVVVPVF